MWLTNLFLRPQKTSPVPLVFLPGSSASVNRFDKLLKQLGYQSVMKIQVSSGGTTVKGKLDGTIPHPAIVFGFEDNRDLLTTIQYQAQQVDRLLRELFTRHGISNFYAIGHSNGGLVWTSYLAHATYLPKLLFTLGSPYNWYAQQGQADTPAYRYFKQLDLPKIDQVVSVVGDIGDGTDGIVSLASTQKSQALFGYKARCYQLVRLNGVNSGHSQLVLHPWVIAYLQTFLTNK